MNDLRRFAVVGLALAAVAAFSGCSGGLDTAATDEQPAATDPLGDRIGSGTARVSGTVRAANVGDALPVGGVPITLGDAATSSNVDGSFVLVGVPAGRQQLFVDGSALATRDGHYAEMAAVLEIVAGEDLLLDRPVYLPFVTTASEQAVTLDAWTTVTSAEGVALEIPPGGARQAGVESDGPVSVQVIAADRTPVALPERFVGRVLTVASIQPADLGFPVPATLTTPSSLIGEEEDGRNFFSLWSLDAESGGVNQVAVAVREDAGVQTVAGGVGGGGWYFLTDLEFAVRSPCQVGDNQAAQECSAAALYLLNTVQELNAARLPGARTVLGRFAAALAGRGRTLARGQAVLEISADLYDLVVEGLAEYQDLYRQLEDLETVSFSLMGVGDACDFGGCGPDPTLPLSFQDKLSTQLDTARDNVETFSWRFNRLSAAMSALTPYYKTPDVLTAETLADFDSAGAEFTEAFDGFPPYASPVDAYDDLVKVLAAMQNTALTLLENVSTSAGDASQVTTAVVQRVCAGLGTTYLASVDQGYAGLDLGNSEGQLTDDCIVLAIDRAANLAGTPRRETDLIDTLRSPLILGLTCLVESNPLQPGVPVSGVLTAESPVAEWTFDAQQRQMIQVAFSSSGDALVGLVGSDGVVQLAGSRSFEVANLSGGTSFALDIYAIDLHPDEELTYTLSVNASLAALDYGVAITGSFSDPSQAAAVLLSANAGERILIESHGVDVFGAAYRYVLHGPDGQEVPQVGYNGELGGVNSGLFDLPLTGLYRVIVTPFPGRFPDYEITISRAAAGDVLSYSRGSGAAA